MIEIRHLRKAFGDHVIFSDLSLTVKKGETVVIIGPSGCGKSTLLRCLNGLEPIQGGTIYLNGKPLEYGRKSLVKIRQKIGMVFQNYDLFPNMTVLQNILLSPVKVQKRNRREAKEEAEQLLEKVGLREKADAYPDALSGGQKQRTAIVRSLIMHPDILLLDEITAALDPEMVHEVLDVVMELSRNGTAMLIVTHEMAFAEAAADRVIFLDGGRILEEGEPQAFFHSPQTERARRFLSAFTYSES
ncbi:MAG: amino acid ABC transporter ATP-binding protein [Ruminococcus sp.]|nr:amino acid ABC transporter ATP-binding protein [Ruminococcus sp.]